MNRIITDPITMRTFVLDEMLENSNDDNFLYVGRKADCQIVLAPPPKNWMEDWSKISRRHGIFIFSGDKTVIYKDTSSNGSQVGQRRLSSGDTISLKPGNQIRLASYHPISFEAVDTTYTQGLPKIQKGVYEGIPRGTPETLVNFPTKYP